MGGNLSGLAFAELKGVLTLSFLGQLSLSAGFPDPPPDFSLRRRAHWRYNKSLDGVAAVPSLPALLLEQARVMAAPEHASQCMLLGSLKSCVGALKPLLHQQPTGAAAAGLLLEQGLAETLLFPPPPAPPSPT